MILPSGGRWPIGGRKAIYLSLVVLGSCAFVMMVYALIIAADYRREVPAFGDFFALWSYGKVPEAALYDPVALHALQIGLGMPEAAENPFPYPPIAILLFRPLAWLPYHFSYVAWVAGTLGLFVWAVAATCSRLAIPLAGVVVAPVSVSCIAAGQTGFLAAALLVAGLRLAERRPIVGGVLIGMLAFKPQMAMLTPIAFAATRSWRSGAAACGTALGLTAVATAAYGPGAWADWLAMLPAYTAVFDGDATTLALKPTVMGSLQMAGVGLAAARVIQGLVAIGVAVLVWRCFRRDTGRLAVAALLVGTMLATPHAFVYDMPVVAAAIALLIQERILRDPAFSLSEIGVLVLAFTAPILMMMGFAAPVTAIPLALLFALIVRETERLAGWRSGPESNRHSRICSNLRVADISGP